MGGASEDGQGLSPWTGKAQERLAQDWLDSEMPPPAEPQVQVPRKTKGRPSKKPAIQVATTDAVTAAGRRWSSRGAGTRPGYYRAMHNGQWAFAGAVVLLNVNENVNNYVLFAI